MAADAPIDKVEQLRRKKRMALAALLVAAATFLVTSVLPPSLGVACLKAVAEASMVGALADWFAVVALFRRPLGLPIPHTAVIPSNKDRIAASMSQFVKEKFLDPLALADLIRRSEPADRVADWLQSPANRARVGRHAAGLVKAWLELVDDKRIQAFFADAARSLIGRVDLAPALASVLDMLTRGGRHQQLLDDTLRGMTGVLKKPEARAALAQRVVEWARQEHRYTQMMLPTEWLADKFSGGALEALDVYLQKVAETPEHELRARFDEFVQRLIERLRTDPDFLRKGEEIKAYLQDNDALAAYARQLWGSVHDWLSADIDRVADDGSAIAQGVEKVGAWLATQMAADPELRASLNEHMEALARDLAPRFSDFLTRHIRETIEKWDARDLSRQVELQIGPDLQYIRISGTLVGGLIGLLLFLASQGMPALWAWFAA